MELFRRSSNMSKLIEQLFEYRKKITIAAVLIAVIGGGWLVRSSHRVRQAQTAHKAFADGMKYFDAPVRGASDEEYHISQHVFATEVEKWTKVAQVFTEGYDKNQGCDIAPLFLAMKAEALVQLKKYADARAALTTMLAIMPVSALYDYYQIKLALLNVDSGEQALVDSGLAQLQATAADTKNAAQDLALYHLGYYYWHQKNFDQAKNYWNQLEHAFGPETKNPSPWYAQIKNKLKLITSA